MTRKDSFILLVKTYCEAFHPLSDPASQINNIYQAMRLVPDCIPADILFAVEEWVAWRVAMFESVKACEPRPEPPSWVVQIGGPGVHCDDYTTENH